MFNSESSLRARYGETDQMGYVYYGNYALYYEVARVDALRTIGMTYRELEENSVMMPVIKMECEYLKAVKYDELLTIKVIIKELPRIRMPFFYEIYNEAGELVNKGTTTLVFINMKTNKPVRCPEKLFLRLKPYFAE